MKCRLACDNDDTRLTSYLVTLNVPSVSPFKPLAIGDYRHLL